MANAISCLGRPLCGKIKVHFFCQSIQEVSLISLSALEELANMNFVMLGVHSVRESGQQLTAVVGRC